MKESDVLFELKWVICGGTWFICALGQLVGKASKPILKEKIFDHQKKVNSQFSKKFVISSRNFQKRLQFPCFAPCTSKF